MWNLFYPAFENPGPFHTPLPHTALRKTIPTTSFQGSENSFDRRFRKALLRGKTGEFSLVPALPSIFKKITGGKKEHAKHERRQRQLPRGNKFAKMPAIVVSNPQPRHGSGPENLQKRLLTPLFFEMFEGNSFGSSQKPRNGEILRDRDFRCLISKPAFSCLKLRNRNTKKETDFVIFLHRIFLLPLRCWILVESS